MNTLFPLDREYYFAKVPHSLVEHADCTVRIRSVVYALAALADSGVKVPHRREEILLVAKVGVSTYVAAIRWLKQVGAIEQEDCNECRSGRVIKLLWNAPNFSPREHGSNKEVSARPGTPSARPGTPSARPGTPSARPGTPLPYRENLGEEEENVPSRLFPDLPACEPEKTIEVDGTGRDDGATLQEGGLAQPPESKPESEEIPIDNSAAIAELEALIAEKAASMPPDRPPNRLAAQLARIGLIDLRDQLEALRNPQPPPKPKPPATAPPVIAPAPLKVRIDDSFPQAEAFRLTKLLDADHSGPAQIGEFAEFLAARWRDAKPETIEHFRQAANLGSDYLANLIRECESPKVNNPARYFASRTAEQLAINRQRRKQRCQNR